MNAALNSLPLEVLDIQPKQRKPPAGEPQPSAGFILEPAKGSKELEVLAYNTRVPAGGFVYETKSNVSHAEHQFTDGSRILGM